MALFKRKGSRLWWISVYRGPDKPRLRKSTGTDDENAARIIEQNAMMLNRNVTSKQRAMAIIEAVVPETEQSLEIKGVRAFYEGIVKADGITISRLEWQKRLNALSRMSLWVFQHSNVRWTNEVTSEIAWNYSQALGKGKTVKTRNNEIGHLRAAWVELMKHGKAKENPWALARAKRKPEEEKSGRAFTDEEIVRILAEAKKAGYEWYAVCIGGLYTGWRMRDVETLMRQEIDFKNGLIVIEPGKNKHINRLREKKIVVRTPIHPTFLKVLKEATPDEEGYLFPWRARHPSGHRPKENDVGFSEILKRAKVETGAGEKVTFHCFRHTFNTWLAEDPQTPQDVRMRLSGHTQAKTNEIYVHEDGQSRAAIGRMKTVE